MHNVDWGGDGSVRGGPTQQLHQVQHVLPHPRLFQAPGQLQVTAGVGGDQVFGAGGSDVAQFAVEDLAAFIGELQPPGGGGTAAPA